MLNFDNEQWLEVKGYEGLYWVSNLGRVRNKSKVMKQQKINSGYLTIPLYLEGSMKRHLVHRLVASAFVAKPEGCDVVNHIDYDRLNNNFSNLEWTTTKGNLEHSRASENWVYNKPTLGKKTSKVSKYHNVGFDKSRGKWTGCVRVNNKNIKQRRFNTEVEAAAYVNRLLDEYNITDRPRNVIE